MNLACEAALAVYDPPANNNFKGVEKVKLVKEEDFSGSEDSYYKDDDLNDVRNKVDVVKKVPITNLG